jgi:hypothetical protein
MIDIKTYNSKYLHNDFLQKTNILDWNNNDNIIKITNLYNSIYWVILRNSEITELLQENITEIHTYNKYKFYEKWTNKEIYFFDILISKKEIFINDNLEGYIYNYNDDIQLWKIVNSIKITHWDRWIELSLNERIATIQEFWKFLQKNIFLHLFRTLFVNIHGEIVNIFHLRFFNMNELSYLWQEYDVFKNLLWQDIKKDRDIVLEKVDGQLIMIYKYNNDVYFQSKWAITTLSEIRKGRVDKNGVFWNLLSMFHRYQYNIDDIKHFLIQDVVYHFELLHNNTPILQEYKNPWLYLLWWRKLSDLSFLINTYNADEYIYWYNNIYYNIEKFNQFWKSQIIYNIVIWNNTAYVSKNIKKIRNPGNIPDDNYVIEWFVGINSNLFFKVKEDTYFIKKIMSSFSKNKSIEILRAINKCYLIEWEKLLDVSKTIISWNYKDLDFLNKNLNTIKFLNKDRPSKISYWRFLKYLISQAKLKDDNTKDIDSVLNIIWNIKDSNDLISLYKEFLIDSCIDGISNMLSNDREEVSSLSDILWLNQYEYNILIKSENLKKEIKTIIYHITKHECWNLYLVSKIKEIINDIQNILI